MKNYVQDDCSVEVVAPFAVTSGDMVAVGSLFGISHVTAAISEKIVIELEGIFTVKKKSTDVVSAGNKLNWKLSTKELQLAAGDLDGVATAVESVGSGNTSIKVRLTPV